jgi:hypothetical protein
MKHFTLKIVYKIVKTVDDPKVSQACLWVRDYSISATNLHYESRIQNMRELEKVSANNGPFPL